MTVALPRRVIETAVAWADRIPASAVAVLARLSIATVFWRSGRTKVDGFSITDSTYTLFAYEYRVPLIPPELAATLATVAEHMFPLLLVVGLATRFSALALFGMTMVIQTFVYPDAWPTHLLWITGQAYLIARGPGVLSVDHLIRQRIRSTAVA